MNKNEELLPYYEKARETLDYNSDTGIFTRILKINKVHKEVGTLSQRGYIVIGIGLDKKRKLLKAHRIAWFIANGSLPYMIDHVDGNKINNSINNLRECNREQNGFNRGKQTNNKSGFKGVSWAKCTKKWRAQIGYNGKVLNLGHFDCPKEASEVYQAKAKELHGEFYAEEA